MANQKTAVMKALHSPSIIWEFNLHEWQEWIHNVTLAKVTWLSDINQALNKAKQTNHRMLAAFVATNCGFCQALETNVFDVAYFAVWANSHNLVLFKHEIPDYHQPDALCQQYNVGPQVPGGGFPTVVGLNPDGTDRGRLVGVPAGLSVTAQGWCGAFENSANLNQTP